MEIRYIGHSSFLIKGKNASIITDPYDSSVVGLKFPKHLNSDMVTVSHDHPDHNAVAQIEGNPFIVTGPGEYDIKGVSIVGVGSFHDPDKGTQRGINTIYRIEIDGITVVHLGDIGHVPPADVIDTLDGVDILMIPVGGIYTVDAEQAKNIISEIEPSVILPMHFGRAELNKETFGTLDGISRILTVMGKENLVPQPKLTLTKDRIPEEQQVILLESKE